MVVLQLLLLFLLLNQQERGKEGERKREAQALSVVTGTAAATGVAWCCCCNAAVRLSCQVIATRNLGRWVGGGMDSLNRWKLCEWLMRQIDG